METMQTTEYDGCGMCLVGARRLSRKTDKSSSPERQGAQIIRSAAQVGGHIIAWADDWEVSGATDPLRRNGLGPWLLGTKGLYDGIAAASVDRIGRNLRDVLNTQDLLTRQGLVIVTADHQGIWDFSNTNDKGGASAPPGGPAARPGCGLRPVPADGRPPRAHPATLNLTATTPHGRWRAVAGG